jgi:hypothetical protein
MALRRPVRAGAVVLLFSVLLVGSGLIGTPEPTVALENEDTDTYYVTAYTVADQDAAGFLNFEVTTEEGEQRLVTYEELVWPGEYHNVTLVDDGIDTQSFVVEPDETVSGTIEAWSHGDMTVYIAERGSEREHTTSRVVTCGSRGQSHSFTLEESGGGSSSSCAGGFGWIAR